MKADTERLNFILRKASEDASFNVQDVLGDIEDGYEGDDEEEYFESARGFIDKAMAEDPNEFVN